MFIIEIKLNGIVFCYLFVFVLELEDLVYIVLVIFDLLYVFFVIVNFFICDVIFVLIFILRKLYILVVILNGYFVKFLYEIGKYWLLVMDVVCLVIVILLYIWL